MRIGCTLPTFTAGGAAALEAALAAESAGLDGVFVFDHLWPMGQPGRPSIAGKLVLGAVAAATRRIALGTLVARIGLLPAPTLCSELAAIDLVSGGRLIAGIGTGDAKSDAEQRAFGLPVAPAAERRAALLELATTLRERGTEVWVGGGSPATDALARECGAVLNLWDVPAAAVAAAARAGPVSWGGPLPKAVPAAAARLAELAAAGAAWVVWAWPGSLEGVAAAVEASGVRALASEQRRNEGRGGSV